MRTLVLCALFCCGINSVLYAQIDTTGIEQDLWEWEWLSIGSDETEEEYDLERIEQQKVRLDLNAASLRELEDLPGLSAEAAFAIYQKRALLGGFDSLDQVLRVRGMTRTGRAALRIFGYVGPKYSNALLWSRWHGRLRSRWQQEDRPRQGSSSGAWPGSRFRTLHRVGLSWGDEASLMLLMDKDAGERRWDDHVSGVVQWTPPALPVRVLAGDFALQSGLGLVFARPAGPGGTPSVRGGALVLPAASARESGGSRGLGVEASWKSLTLALAVSHTARDGSWDSVRSVVTSLREDGLHRTAREREGEDLLHETMLASILRWREPIATGWVQGAVAVTDMRTDRILDPRTPFGRRGRALRLGGIAFGAVFSEWSLGAELARTEAGAWAWLGMGSYSPSHRLLLRLHLRGYTPDYVSPFGAAIAARSGDLSNEQGAGLVWEWLPWESLRLTAEWDQAAYPNRTWLLHLPSTRWETRVTGEWTESRQLTLSLRLHRSMRDETVSERDVQGREWRPLVTHDQCGLKVQCGWRASTTWSLTLRAEAHQHQWSRTLAPSCGSLLQARIRSAPWTGGLLDVAVACFHTESWDSRVYLFEPDLPGTLRSIAVAGNGLHAVVQGRQVLPGGATLTIRYSWVAYSDRLVIGSGEDAVGASRLGLVSMQVDWSW